MIVVMVVMLLMVMAAAAMAVFVVMVIMDSQVLGGSVLTLHSGHDLRTGQLIPGSGDQGSLGIMLTQQSHSGIQLGLCDGVRPGQDDSLCRFDLIIVELAEVLHIDLHLACISNCHGAAQNHIVTDNLLYSLHNIGQLANAGGFNDDPVGMIPLNDLHQRLAEIAHQAAANAAGVHLGNVDTGILQEAAVDADLTELIFDEHQLLAAVGLLDHLLDEGGLAGAQKARVNINDSHRKHLLYKDFLLLYHFSAGFTRHIFTYAPNKKSAGSSNPGRRKYTPFDNFPYVSKEKLAMLTAVGNHPPMRPHRHRPVSPTGRCIFSGYGNQQHPVVGQFSQEIIGLADGLHGRAILLGQLPNGRPICSAQDQ